MGATKIEWADLTFNCWVGCEKVSPACARCYAEGQARRFNGPGLWGADHRFKFQTDDYWAKPLQWARTWPAKLGRRPRVFCASMADVFEDRPELQEARVRLYALILRTPELDWLLLTKRPEEALRWLRDPENWLQVAYAYAQHFEDGDNAWDYAYITTDRGPRNVWMGVSIENARYTWRADVLREVPAAVRFISAEPLLGSLFKAPSASRRDDDGAVRRLARAASDSAEVTLTEASPPRGVAPLDLTDIDWVIAGGESGAKARPSHPDWFRELRDACLAGCDGCAERHQRISEAGREILSGHACSGRPAFLFKQWGEWAPGDNEDVRSGEFHGGGDWIADCMCTEGTERLVRTGKKINGRELDGRTWDEFPQSAAAAVPA